MVGKPPRGLAAPGPARPWHRAGPGIIAGLVLALMLGPGSHVHAQQAPAGGFQASTAPLLFEAVRGNDLAGVKSAVKAGADVTRKDDDGRTALDIALQHGFFDIAQFLIKARQEQLDPSIGRTRGTEPASTASRMFEADNAPPPEPQIQPQTRNAAPKAETPTEEARAAPNSPPTQRAQPIKRLRAPIRDALFTLGETVSIGQPKPARGVGEPDACVSKPGLRAFCVVPVDWPSEVESAFQVDTILYQGARALARYDRGAASHFHALFRSDDQEKVLAFLKKRYGKPTDEWKRVIAPAGEPRRANPTFAWRSRNTETKLMTILEVRKFDDARNVFPDTGHGVVRLYVAGGPPVFPAVSALDIMSIDWAARSGHDDAPPNSRPAGR